MHIIWLVSIGIQRGAWRRLHVLLFRMLGVYHQQVWRVVTVWRSPSRLITESDSDSSSWVIADADDSASSWTTDDEADDIEDTATAETTTSTTIRDGSTTLLKPPTSNTAAKRLSCLLVLLLVLTPFLLHRCADRPLAVVSTISLLVLVPLLLHRVTVDRDHVRVHSLQIRLPPAPAGFRHHPAAEPFRRHGNPVPEHHPHRRHLRLRAGRAPPPRRR